jgi:CubicO group peptidase (beta-lactamase class C family)
MKRYFGITLFLLSAVFLINIQAQPNKKYSPEVEEKIKQVEQRLGGWAQIGDISAWTLQERMKFYHANGVSIAVIKDYKIDWARGYGWADSAVQRPATTSTLFQAGSISKSLNAVGVLKLVQERKLNLYTDINEYLKTWKFPYDSVSKGIKISTANLLSHTAGLTIHGFPGYAQTDSIPTIVNVLDGKRPANTKAVRSQFEPSLRFQYSGGGTTISQLLIQDITGQSYEEYMWKNVLRPMGMISSSFMQPPQKEKGIFLATAYYNDGKEVKGKYHIYPEQAAAGLWTNPTELAKYIIETQLSLQGKSAKVLSREMTWTRLTPYIDSAAALGVFITKKEGDKYFGHGGVDEGFVSQYYGSLEGGNGVVVMANTYNTSILNEIINSVATVYNWKNFYTPVMKKLVPVNNEVLETYIGKYKLQNDTITIIKEPEGLILLDHDSKLKMYFTSDTDFFLFEAEKAAINFTKDSIGKVEGFTIRQGRELKAKKIH